MKKRNKCESSGSSVEDSDLDHDIDLSINDRNSQRKVLLLSAH